MFQHFVGTKVSHEGGSKVVCGGLMLVSTTLDGRSSSDCAPWTPHSSSHRCFWGVLSKTEISVNSIISTTKVRPWWTINFFSLAQGVSKEKSLFQFDLSWKLLRFFWDKLLLRLMKMQDLFSQKFCQLKIGWKMVISLGQMVRGQKSPRLGLLWHTFYAR